MKKLDINSKEYILKMMEISGEILEIASHQGEMPNGDYQGCIEAQVVKAIQYGFDLANKTEPKKIKVAKIGPDLHSYTTPENLGQLFNRIR